MKKLYVFGNEHLAHDAMAHRVAHHLRDHAELVHCRSPDDLLEEGEREILILDVVNGAEEPIIIDDIRQIKTRPMMSLHDFDLGYFLTLMSSLGQEKKVRIIGLPSEGDSLAFAEKVRTWI